MKEIRTIVIYKYWIHCVCWYENNENHCVLWHLVGRNIKWNLRDIIFLLMVPYHRQRAELKLPLQPMFFFLSGDSIKSRTLTINVSQVTHYLNLSSNWRGSLFNDPTIYNRRCFTRTHDMLASSKTNLLQLAKLQVRCLMLFT